MYGGVCGRRGELSVEDTTLSSSFVSGSPLAVDLRSMSAWWFSVDSRYSVSWFLNSRNKHHARFSQHPYGGERSILFDNSSCLSCVGTDCIQCVRGSECGDHSRKYC